MSYQIIVPPTADEDLQQAAHFVQVHISFRKN